MMAPGGATMAAAGSGMSMGGVQATAPAMGMAPGYGQMAPMGPAGPIASGIGPGMLVPSSLSGPGTMY